ncbi:uncharacterized protein LOC5506329 [Nematostella vectensis]|uniref:uncharacterized protein LOC5506329 n=1 Tax=Nematostella vectensis TaxID=45351 RepID=UPI00138FC6B7|nr:uncharacterized protein LOC5506329 [Nematostella vectensis]
MALKSLLNEFQLKNCRLLYHNSADFTESPWFPVLGVLIYRLVFAIYCFAWLIAGTQHPSNGQEKWFIYLTNWSYLILTLYFACSTALTAVYYRGEWFVGEYDVQDHDALKPRSRSRPGDPRDPSCDQSRERLGSHVSPLHVKVSEPMNWYHYPLWLLHIVAANSAVAVCLVYWMISYPSYQGYTPDGLDISTHLLNALFVVIDLCLSSLPVRLLQIIYPFVYFIIYLIFLVLYWASDGTNANGQPYVYKSTDFTERPARAAGFAIGFPLIFQMLAQVILFSLYKLRCWGSEKLMENQGAVYKEGCEIERQVDEIDV